VSFDLKENFPDSTYQLINQVYDDGNTYVHARKSPNKAIDDAETCLNRLGKVLAHLYNVTGDLTGKEITTGYSFFPDVCQGTHFGLDVYLTPEAATRGYYNLPSQQQIDQMFSLVGVWQGEWKENEGNNQYCKLDIFIEGEYLRIKLISIGSEELNRILTIKLYVGYFHLINYNDHKEITLHFELEVLNDKTLLGDNLLKSSKALFVRQVV
jgi:hypothetical protein